MDIKARPPGAVVASLRRGTGAASSVRSTAASTGSAAGSGERKKYYEATVKELKEYGREAAHAGGSYRLILEVAAARKLVTLRIGVSEGA